MTMINFYFDILINEVKYETGMKVVNGIETIQNKNIMSIMQANQTKNGACIRT